MIFKTAGYVSPTYYMLVAIFVDIALSLAENRNVPFLNHAYKALDGSVAFPTSEPTVSESAQHLKGVSGGAYARCPAKYKQLNLLVHLA